MYKYTVHGKSSSRIQASQPDDKREWRYKNDENIEGRKKEYLQLEVGPQSSITEEQPDGTSDGSPRYSVNCSDWLILKTSDYEDTGDEECQKDSPQWRLSENATICLEEIDIKVEILDEDDQLINKTPIQAIREERTKSKFSPNSSHPCDFCPRVFIYKSSLTVHTRLHTGEHMFTCEKCPKKFPKRNLLELHVRSHTGERPYSCQFCTVKFSSKSSQQVHLRIHTGEKPHSCDTCSKKFARRTHLTQHQRIHTGDQPFQCDLCPKKFSSKMSLTVHRRVHTGEKPYSCTQCPKGFVQRTNLSTHMLTHTDERPFNCTICPSKFKRKQTLTKHNFKHRQHESQETN